MSLPTLLAGPILKYASSEKIKLWFASSVHPEQDSLALFCGDEPLQNFTVRQETLTLGEQLFVSVFTVHLTSPLPNTELSYELTLDEVTCLAALNLSLKANQSRPGFTLDAQQQRFAHASCRKPHGAGKDAFVLLEKELHDSPVDALFLTGDQIYADDVDRTLFSYIKVIENSLQIAPERFAGLGTAPEPSRTELLEKQAHFTSESADCHLMTLSEYVIMHLMAFSPTLWPEQCAPHLEAYYEGCIAINKIMANTPTYFMFDDHEVTDDWCLDEAWRHKVENTSLGKQVIANALTGFFICQAWGTHDDIDRHLPLIRKRLAALSNASLQEQVTQLNWSYEAPTTPATLVLDTHTARYGFKGDMQIVRPELLDKLQQRQEKQLILVSPAPVFGISILEKAQDISAHLLGSTKVDHERWFSKAFHNLMHNLAKSKLDNVMILSGDFHYSMNIQARVEREHRTPLHLYQMVSSASKNEVPAMWLLNVVSIIRSLLKPSAKGKGVINFQWRLRFLKTFKHPTVLNKNNTGIVQIKDRQEYIVSHQLLSYETANKEPIEVTFEPSFWRRSVFHKAIAYGVIGSVVGSALLLCF